MRVIKIIFIVLGFALLTAIGLLFAFGHMFSAGTHGSIKSYEYPVSKENLEDAINKIILENNSLYRPSQDTVDFNSETD